MHMTKKAAQIGLLVIAGTLALSACEIKIAEGEKPNTIKVRVVSASPTQTSAAPTDTVEATPTEEASSTPTPTTEEDPTPTAVAPLPKGLNLQPEAAQSVRQILNATGFEGTVFGRAARPDNPKSDHPAGLAADFMTSGSDGDRIAAYAEANKKALGVKYVLWQVEDHFDHVHVSFKDR